MVLEASDGTSTVTLNGKLVATYPPCPCPAVSTLGSCVAQPDGGGVCDP